MNKQEFLSAVSRLQKMLEIHNESLKEKLPISIVTKDGKLEVTSVNCPFCYEADGGEIELKFQFGDHTFHCEECEEEYTIEQLVEQAETCVSNCLTTLHGLFLVAPVVQAACLDKDEE